jgi:hypothetical protein
MSLEYAHQQKDSGNHHSVVGTVVVQMPNREELEHIFLTHSNMTMFLAGVSIKSKCDKFIKKEGRRLAELRLAPVIFQFDGVVQHGTKHIYNFFTNKIKINKQMLYLRISLTTVKESKNVRLISAYIENFNEDEEESI